MAQTVSKKENHFNRKVYLLILVLVFLLYGNSIRNSYALDDNYVTVPPGEPGNARVAKGIKGIPALFTTHYVESGSQSFEYRPLVLVTFAIEYQFFGSNPHVSHLISILLYALTCMLLYHVLCLLFKSYNIILPLLTVFLFIIHPIHTEVVDNIKCRDELLSFLFGLCSLLFFLKTIETKKRKFIVTAVLFLFLSLLCKRTAMLFLVFIPLTLYFFSALDIRKIALLEIIPLFVFWGYNFFKNSLIKSLPVKREFVFYENSLFFDHTLTTKLEVAFCSLGYYLKLLFFPYPLSCYYGYDTIPTRLFSPFCILSMLFYLAIAIYTLVGLSKKHILSYALLIYLGGVFPFSNLVQPVVGIIGERFVYFASLGFCMALAYLLVKLFKVNIKDTSKLKIKNTSLSLKTSFVLLLLIYSSLTIARNTKWKDELTLFKNDIANFQNSCNLYYILGNKLYNELSITPDGAKRNKLISECKLYYEQALELMKTGIQKYPKDFTTLNNIGMIYMKIFDDAPAALLYFKRAMALNTKEGMIQFNVALCYEKKNQPDSAIMIYEKAISKNTAMFPSYVQLHELYLKKQAYAKAIVCDAKAIKQFPGSAQLYVNLANALLLNRDTLNGILEFEKAIELEPNNKKLKENLATFLKISGYTEKPNKK